MYATNKIFDKTGKYQLKFYLKTKDGIQEYSFTKIRTFTTSDERMPYPLDCGKITIPVFMAKDEAKLFYGTIPKEKLIDKNFIDFDFGNDWFCQEVL